MEEPIFIKCEPDSRWLSETEESSTYEYESQLAPDNEIVVKIDPSELHEEERYTEAYKQENITQESPKGNLQTNTGVKQHVCEYCGKAFKHPSQLRLHTLCHTGETEFICQYCSKPFNRRSRLTAHIRFIHEGDDPYQCAQCKRAFFRREDLVRHFISHSGVKAHKCPTCQKAFGTKSTLRIHQLTHRKEPPLACDECGRAFIRQDCFVRHLRTKHRLKK
ncbi:zinc finger protein 2 [Anabrus simplex]|uniref:zinc finger protein 2 n=1 Tax=Anabrus simplex TaxID=316456 RepID=UPI0034DDA04B